MRFDATKFTDRRKEYIGEKLREDWEKSGHDYVKQINVIELAESLMFNRLADEFRSDFKEQYGQYPSENH